MCHIILSIQPLCQRCHILHLKEEHARALKATVLMQRCARGRSTQGSHRHACVNGEKIKELRQRERERESEALCIHIGRFAVNELKLALGRQGILCYVRRVVSFSSPTPRFVRLFSALGHIKVGKQAPERVRVQARSRSCSLCSSLRRRNGKVMGSLSHSAEVNSVGRVESAKFGRRLKFKAAVVAQAGAKC